MDFNDGRSIQIKHFIPIHSILSIIVDKDSKNAYSPNVMDCRFGRSIHSNIHYQLNTSNHKAALKEIGRLTSNRTNFYGL